MVEHKVRTLLNIKDQVHYSESLSHTETLTGLFFSLLQIHLIVTVPKYYDQNITEEVTVQMLVSSGGKVSEPHSLTYYPLVTKKGKFARRWLALPPVVLASIHLCWPIQGKGEEESVNLFCFDIVLKSMKKERKRRKKYTCKRKREREKRRIKKNLYRRYCSRVVLSYFFFNETKLFFSIVIVLCSVDLSFQTPLPTTTFSFVFKSR